MSDILRFRNESLNIADPAFDERPLGDDFLKILRAFLEDTYATCTYHRQRLDKAQLRLDDLDTLDAFERIPLMRSWDITALTEASLLPDRYQAGFAAGLNSFAPEDRIAKKFLTGSSTGKPKVSYWTVTDWDSFVALIGRHMGHLPLNKWSRVLNCFHAGSIGGKYTEEFNRYGCLVENRHPTATTDEQVLRQLYSSFGGLGGANCISVPPWRPKVQATQKGTTLDDLLNLDVENYIGQHISLISTGGAPFDVPELRLRERIWEANEQAGTDKTMVIVKYGCSEVGTFAADCLHNDGLHIYQGAQYVEVVDENTGRQVKNGERGLVVVTGLRHGSRFIRYAVGDEATYVSDTCKCGKKNPRIQEIRRVKEVERLKGGCAAGGY